MNPLAFCQQQLLIPKRLEKMEAWDIIIYVYFLKRNYLSEVYIMANYIVLGTWNTKHDYRDSSVYQLFSHLCNRFLIDGIRDFWIYSEISVIVVDKTPGDS